MASPDAGLVAALVNDATIAGIVSGRVYHGERPQKSVIPAIVWTRSSVQREMLLDGPSSLATAFYQLEAIASASIESRALADAISDALHGVTGNLGGATVSLVQITNELDVSDIDGDLKIRHVLIDVEIIFPE